MYESDFPLFMQDFLQKNPAVAAAQQTLRLTHWDKTVDIDAQRRYAESAITRKAQGASLPTAQA